MLYAQTHLTLPPWVHTEVDANRRYEARFGYIFIVCATGLSAAQMLEALTTRLNNPPEQEIRIAAAEQLKITELRLDAVTDRFPPTCTPAS